LPSQNVKAQMKFWPISLPNSFNTSEKMYFYDAFSLAIDELATNKTA